MANMDTNKKSHTPGGTPAGTPPGDPNDRLYVIYGGQYYRLAAADIKVNPPVTNTGDDVDVYAAIQDLAQKNSVVADLPGKGAGAADSCICIVLNIDMFEGSLQAKANKR